MTGRHLSSVACACALRVELCPVHISMCMCVVGGGEPQARSGSIWASASALKNSAPESHHVAI